VNEERDSRPAYVTLDDRVLELVTRRSHVASIYIFIPRFSLARSLLHNPYVGVCLPIRLERRQMASDLLAQRLRELKAKLDQLLTDAVSLRVNIDQMLDRPLHPASPV